jgi:hypothetical protein
MELGRSADVHPDLHLGAHQFGQIVNAVKVVKVLAALVTH